jgi:glutaredoxin
MIKLYTLKKCKHCHDAKDWLKSKNIEFEEIDLTAKENRESRAYYRELGVETAPIIAGEKRNGLKWILCGFDEDKKIEIERLINE